jgi:hypothetical protein
VLAGALPFLNVRVVLVPVLGAADDIVGVVTPAALSRFLGADEDLL